MSQKKTPDQRPAPKPAAPGDEAFARARNKKRRDAFAAALGEFRPRGPERWGMFLIGYAVACYVAFVICSKLFLLLPLTEGLWVYLLFPVLAPVVYWLMCLALQYTGKDIKRKKKNKETPKEAALRRLKALYPTVCASRAKLSPAVFFGAFLGVSAVLALGLLAQYPGGFVDTDIGWQWIQVQTGSYDSWHPPIHTFLIWLVTRIVDSYGFFIAVQVLFFGLMAGYMASTLRAWGIQPLWIALFAAAIVSTHSTRGMLLYAYKDSMFTCFALWTAVCVVNIALSRGEWLGKWGNRAGFAVSLAFTSTIRLNGFFFTIPIVLLLFLLYGKKQAFSAAFSGGLALLLVLGVRGPLYSAVGVKQYAGQSHEEWISSPMNILTSIYAVRPGALDEDGVRLMHWLATPAQWAEGEVFFDNYMALKARMCPPLPHMQEEMDIFLEEYASRSPLDKLLPTLWRAVKNEPALAVKALVHSSSSRWDPTAIQYTCDVSPEQLLWVTLDHPALNEDLDNRLTGVHLRESVLAETKKPFYRIFQKFQAPYRAVEWVLRHLTPGSLLQCVGFHMLALAFCGWFSLRRRRGWGALLLALPSFAYILPTLPLIPGPNYRMFHFTVVITVPLVLVCLAKTPAAKPQRK